MITENFVRLADEGDEFLAVTTIVDDPLYFDAAVHQDLRVQAGARRIEMEPHALFSQVIATRLAGRSGHDQTEIAINVAPGSGVWKTVTGLGKMQRRYLDPVSGQAGYYGLIEEGGAVAVATVRVRVQNRRISEAEWYLARENDPGLNGPRQPGRPPANLHNPGYLIANPPPERVVPAAQRASRDELIAIANSYFDAITSHDNSVALTHPGCGRAENGSPAPAGRFLPPATAPAPGAAAPTNDCVSGLANFNLSMGQ